MIILFHASKRKAPFDAASLRDGASRDRAVATDFSAKNNHSAPIRYLLSER